MSNAEQVVSLVIVNTSLILAWLLHVLNNTGVGGVGWWEHLSNQFPVFFASNTIYLCACDGKKVHNFTSWKESTRKHGKNVSSALQAARSRFSKRITSFVLEGKLELSSG